VKKTFAILSEPASYTIERNKAVYDKLGIKYCYRIASSHAKSSSEGTIEALSDMSFIALVKRVRDILRSNDIVIMNGYSCKEFLLLYGLNAFYKRIIGLDSDTQLNISANPLKRIIKKLYLSTIFGNKHIYGLPGGSKSHKELFRYYGMTEDRICLMPMVVNNELFRYDKVRTNSVFRFLFVGRIIELKNIPLMIDAFLKAFKNRMDVEIRIVGNGEFLSKYQSDYKQYQNVVFAGVKYGDELIEEYRLASAFVLPSFFEQWGLVVNEAMAAGLPVIVSDKVGAGADLVEGHNTGFVFRYDDADDLKEKMLRLVEDKALYQQFSKNAYRRVNEEWGYELYTQCLKKFIEKASSQQ
jgi:glycosyltransferase involved in cell wall biosynthesis